MPMLHLLAALLPVSSADAALLHAGAFPWLMHAVCKQVQVARQCPAEALLRLLHTGDLLAYIPDSALAMFVLEPSFRQMDKGTST